MKIAHIVASLEARHGGPSRSVRSLAGAFATLGPEVDLLSTEETAQESRFSSLQVRIFPRGRPEAICPSTGLARYLRAHTYDVVQHHGLWLRTLHYAHQAARRSRAPLVVAPRGMMSGWAWNHHRWKKRLAAAFLHPGALNRLQGWHATSTEEADDIRTLGFKQPICVAPNGVSAPLAPMTEQAITYWRTRCPAVATRPVALFYSRFHAKKRVLELIDLWLEKAPANWLLLMVGIPQQYTVAELENYVYRASGSDRVRIFDGENAPPPYPVASLFLLPSHSENFGLSISEAMAHSLPVVVTDRTPWAALNGLDLGACVPWENYGAAMTKALARGPDALHAQGTAARTWILAEYSWTRSASRLLEFYTTLKR